MTKDEYWDAIHGALKDLGILCAIIAPPTVVITLAVFWLIERIF